MTPPVEVDSIDDLIVGQIRTDDTEVTQAEIDVATIEATAAKAERDRLKSGAYSEAMSKIREAHRDEFDGYLATAYTDRGLTYTPKLRLADRALALIREQLEAFPELRDKLTTGSLAGPSST